MGFLGSIGELQLKLEGFQCATTDRQLSMNKFDWGYLSAGFGATGTAQQDAL